MTKATAKKNVSSVVSSVELTTWDKLKVELLGTFLSHPNGDLSGRIELTDENLATVMAINHGKTPPVTIKDDTQIVDLESIPTSPTNDNLPLWKWVKPIKADNVPGYWLPIQSAFNRLSTAAHVTDLKDSIKRNGFQTHLGRLAIGTKGGCRMVDAGQRSTALSQLYAEGYDLSGQYADVLICAQKDLTGFDEIHRNRSIRDVLAAHGVASQWEQEVQVLLSSLLLLCSGKGLRGSGKTLPHIVGENGKPRKLTESDVVGLLNADYEPFTHIQSAIDCLTQTVVLTVEGGDDTETEEVEVWQTSGVQKFSLPCWLVSIVECLCGGADLKDVQALLLDVASLGDVSKTNNAHVAAVNAWGKTGLLESNVPALVAVLNSYCHGTELPSRRPQSKQGWKIREAYDAWVDSQAE